MRTKEIATAVEAWASSTVTGLNSYPAPPESLGEALPLVIAEVRNRRRRRTGEDREGFQQFQQTAARIWSVQLLILVDPNPEWTASQTLYDITDDLEEAIRKDSTLGGRIPFADSDLDVSFDPPEVEHADGTVARAATMTITIGEQTEV